MTSWATLGDVLEKDGRLSAELKEQVRRTLAQDYGCEYCKAKGKPDSLSFDEKTSVDIGFAQAFCKYEKGLVPDSIFQILHNDFNEEEISELCAFICFPTDQQYFGA